MLRQIKQLLQKESRACICPPEILTCVCGHAPRVRLINKKVITPSATEIDINPRSRSAKLRAAERLSAHGDNHVIAQDDSFISTARARGWRRPALVEKIRMAFLAA